MNDDDTSMTGKPTRRPPWNKGKLIGAKPPLRQGHVWSIRTRLQLENRIRDLALFNLAIDSKLRGCDVVALRVDDVAPNGYAMDRATVRQKKTGRPVRFELTEQTRQAIDEYLRMTGRRPGQFLFRGRPRTRQQSHDAAVCSPRRRVDRKHRSRPPEVRHALHAPNQGDPDLPAHRQSSGRSTAARTHEDREHGSIPRR